MSRMAEFTATGTEILSALRIRLKIADENDRVLISALCPIPSLPTRFSARPPAHPPVLLPQTGFAPVLGLPAARTQPVLSKQGYTIDSIVDTGFLPSLKMTSQPTPWTLQPAPLDCEAVF